MKKVETNEAPSAIGPYSQAVIHHDMVFTSGQIPLDPKTGAINGITIQEQTEQIMKNIKAVLIASGASFETVIKTTCFLKDMANFTAFNEIYSTYFVSKPSRSCVAVRELPKGVLAEVEVVAYVVET